MDTTSISLLQRLQLPEHDDAAWRRFVDIYAPLIFHWGRQRGLHVGDAGDLVQEVLAALLVQLPRFQYRPNGRFRAWLFRVTRNKACDFSRSLGRLPPQEQIEIEQRLQAESEADLFAEEQYRQYLVQRIRQIIETEFEPSTWQACWLQVTEGRSAADVGKELGMSPNAVRVAKCRVLKRLREELAGLLD